MKAGCLTVKNGGFLVLEIRGVICIYLWHADPNASKHKRHTMFVLDPKIPGIEVLRPMQVFGNDDAPHGHMHLKFTDVQIPSSSVVLGEGRGFEVAQGRLGPGEYITVCEQLDKLKKHWK